MIILTIEITAWLWLGFYYLNLETISLVVVYSYEETNYAGKIAFQTAQAALGCSLPRSRGGLALTCANIDISSQICQGLWRRPRACQLRQLAKADRANQVALVKAQTS